MADGVNDIQSFMNREQMIELKRVTFSYYHAKISGLYVFKREHIEKRRKYILEGEELCAVVHIEGVGIYKYPLGNGKKEEGVENLYASMQRMSPRMCDKKIVALLVSIPMMRD